MPTLPADEDYARALLSILGARNLLPMQSLGQDEVRTTFLEQNIEQHPIRCGSGVRGQPRVAAVPVRPESPDGAGR